MAVSSVSRKLTYEDLLHLPDDRRRHEILDGVHHVTASPAPRHQRVLHRATLWIGNHVAARGSGDVFGSAVDTLLSRHDVVVPDLQFIATARKAIVRPKNIQGAPDLVLEILSPSTRRIDLGVKRARYERLGVCEYWILDPDRDCATVYRRSSPEAAEFLPPILLTAEAGDDLTSPLFPGLEIPLRELFAR